MGRAYQEYDTGKHLAILAKTQQLITLREQLIETKQIWALFDHPPARTYTNTSRICLLGDAAHASTPNQGSGGGMAMEDSFIVSSLLAKITGVSDISAAFKAYDEIRRPRSQKLVKTSREAGRLYHLELTEYSDDESLRENLENRFKWIWEEDLDKELAEATELLEKEIGVKASGTINCRERLS